MYDADNDASSLPHVTNIVSDYLFNEQLIYIEHANDVKSFTSFQNIGQYMSVRDTCCHPHKYIADSNGCVVTCFYAIHAVTFL